MGRINVRRCRRHQLFANQTRRAMGLEDHVTMDTEAAIRIGVAAMRKLILADTF